MKFVLRSWKLSALSFFAMPLVMLVLIVLSNIGMVDKSTNIPDWVAMILSWKISSEAFIHALFYSVVTVAALHTYLVTHQDLSKAEQVSISHNFDRVGSFLANSFYFWAGLLLSWSIGSRSLDFIDPVANQEWGALFSLVEGVFFRVFLRRFKHYTVRGISVFW